MAKTYSRKFISFKINLKHSNIVKFLTYREIGSHDYNELSNNSYDNVSMRVTFYKNNMTINIPNKNKITKTIKI